jgi:hypothetical protein
VTSSIYDAVESFTTDQLKIIIRKLTGEKPPAKKIEMMADVADAISKNLNEIWDKLDDLDRSALSETLYSPTGALDEVAFRAKYDRPVPYANWCGGYRSEPPALRLLVYPAWIGGRPRLAIPEDLRKPLETFVPRPVVATLESFETVPEIIERKIKTYEKQADDDGIVVQYGRKIMTYSRKPPIEKVSVKQFPVTVRTMEKAGPQDFHAVLRYVSQGKVSVGEKTGKVSTISAKDLAILLKDGDFYEIIEPKDKWEQQIGPIRAFAWPLLLQAAGFAELHGKKLALTKTGLSALTQPAPETLRTLWQRWMKSTKFDEFQRIDAIKGQNSKGGRGMTALEPRRQAIVSSLKKCPVGRWIKIEEFNRHMQMNGDLFEVAHSMYNLYIGDQRYGNLDHRYGHEWSICQNRYVRCLLFEYAATLGMVDVAFVHPTEVEWDFGNLWGSDDLDFLSRYDGLLYFRLTALGAFCLGMSKEYKCESLAATARLNVMPSLQITIMDEELAPHSALLLDAYAEKDSARTWRLAKHKALTAIEEGHQISELRKFLESGDEQPLPQTVEAFIQNTSKNATALKEGGLAVVIECADVKTADTIEKHKCTKDLCRRLDARTLIVPVEKEQAFRKAVHIVGFGLPKRA